MTVSATATISIVAGYAGIALGRDQPHAQSLLYFVVSVEPWQFYLALTSSAALIAAMMLQANRAWPILLGTGAVGTAAATYTFTPSAAEAFAARGGAAIAVLALELFLFWLWASDRRRTK
ncbi:MAG: hypothetical protein ACRDPV_05970, partial [Gaiellaceae bacterium]